MFWNTDQGRFRELKVQETKSRGGLHLRAIFKEATDVGEQDNISQLEPKCSVESLSHRRVS